MPVYNIDGNESHIYSAEIKDIDNCYIATNEPLEKMLFNRNLIGLKFSECCEAATQKFLKHFEPEIKEAGEDIAELMILTKGLYYWLHNAYAKVYNKNLQINFIYTSRAKVTEETVKVVVKTKNFDAIASNLIIGDTVASGETICVALREYLKYQELKQVFIFSIVGSKIGGQAISKFCKEHGIKLNIIYGLAAFGLASNGFDLSFLHPDTVTQSKYIVEAKEIFKGKQVSAAGWDFGSQSQAIRKYKMLCWLEEKYWGLENSGVFQETEKPTEVRLIEKEAIACKSTIPDVIEFLKQH